MTDLAAIGSAFGAGTFGYLGARLRARVALRKVQSELAAVDREWDESRRAERRAAYLAFLDAVPIVLNTGRRHHEEAASEYDHRLHEVLLVAGEAVFDAANDLTRLLLALPRGRPTGHPLLWHAPTPSERLTSAHSRLIEAMRTELDMRASRLETNPHVDKIVSRPRP